MRRRTEDGEEDEQDVGHHHRATAAGVADEDEGGPSSSNIVVALIDNNSWEVGIAELDVNNPTKLFVSQVTDDRTFMTSLQRLCDIRPREILVPDSHSARPLCESLRSAHGAKVSALTRSFFNETRGGELMNDLNKTPVQGKQHIQSHYLGRAAACALLTYVERGGGGRPAGEPLKRLVVVLDPWIEQSRRLQMDMVTIKSLELVANRRTGGREGTLLSLLKHTKTAMGGRLLRGQLTSPPAQLDTIEARLAAVEELLLQETASVEEGCGGGGGEVLSAPALSASLARMCDLDRLCSRFASEPKGFKMRELKSEIEAVIGVRNFAIELSHVLGSLEPLRTEFWRTAHADLSQCKQVFDELYEAIGQVTSTLAPVASSGGGGGGSSRSSSSNHHLQDIFCVKADVDGMLDVARLAYVQAVTEMHDLVSALRESTGIGKLELKHTASRGYHLCVPRAFEARLPAFFVQAVRNKKSIFCTTPELASLNNRQARLECEIFALTTMRLRPLRAAIADQLSTMLRCSETVALCDMMLALAEVSRRPGYCKPTMVLPSAASSGAGAGGLLVENLRHAVVETLVDEFEPHTVRMVPPHTSQRLLLVTGENCAGKTTYLTQTALCVVLAQLGCFVPATKCHMVVFSRICARLDTDDALDQNASTFSLEMMETAGILQAVSTFPLNKRCLVLIDELGRGTSSRDGLALSCATAEFLIAQPSQPLVMLSTHFLRLRQLTNKYGAGVVGHVTIRPPKKAGSGGGDQDDVEQELDENGGYGIRLARMCGMPEDVVQQAMAFRDRLVAHQQDRQMAPPPPPGGDLDPVAEVFKVLCAIQAKTKIAEQPRDYALARRLLGELRQRLV